MTYRLNEYLICEVPEGDFDFYVREKMFGIPDSGSYLSIWTKAPLNEAGDKVANIDLPEGQWHLVCKGTEVDEDVTAEMFHVLKSREGDFYHWDKDIFSGQWYCHPDTAFEAYLTANNLTADRIVVLKEI